MNRGRRAVGLCGADDRALLSRRMADRGRVRVGVLGAGAWARHAHLPGYRRDPRCEVVAVADPQLDLARDFAHAFDIPSVTGDAADLFARADIDLIDVCTPSHTHFELAWAALEAGKHVLCEKPVAYDFRETLRARDLARRKGLKTKVGLTFRYSPAVRYMRELVATGFVGTPFIFNGYEQNSQWLDPATPLRQVDHTADQSMIQVSSLEGYGAPIIDIARWWVDAGFTRVVGTMRNFVPERVVRATGRMMLMNIDDADIFIGEYANGAIGSVQTSYVAVGNYPGIEARLSGSRGAIVCRLVEEQGVAETIRVATADAVEFRELPIPERFYPPGGHLKESWRTLYYANLIRNFLDEIVEGGQRNEGGFEEGAAVQEVINAVERSFHERRWVDLPLDG